MPGGDGTGPSGMGPMSGRGAGYCAGNDVPGSMNMMPGRGRGFGGGRGRGFGHGMGRGLGWLGTVAAGGLLARTLFTAVSKADEKAVLKDQVTAMEEVLASAKQRLNELEQGE